MTGPEKGFELASLVDSLLSERALLYGSLPPEARDLDLLVPTGQRDNLERGLAGNSFERQNGLWIRFRECSADAVELAAVEAWRLPPPEIEALFRDARPLPGCSRLVRPSPHHELLIAARRATGEIGWRRATLRAARDGLTIHREALEAARDRAPAWGVSAGREALAGALDGRGVPATIRREALRESLATRRTALLGTLTRAFALPARGRVVAFSGLDGAGKSTQCIALEHALERLGKPSVVVWSSVASHPGWMATLVRWVTRILLLARGRRTTGPIAEAPDQRADAVRSAAKSMRLGSPVITFAWSTFVTARVAFHAARRVRPALLRGRTVICDRYLLDADVHLRYQYGGARGYRLHLALLRLAMPRPVRTFYLRVSPETASRRKADYDLGENAKRARLYDARAPYWDAVEIDGELPPDEICATAAVETWRRLLDRDRRRFSRRLLNRCKRALT